MVISIDYTIKLSRANMASKDSTCPSHKDEITKATKEYHIRPMRLRTQKCISMWHGPNPCWISYMCEYQRSRHKLLAFCCLHKFLLRSFFFCFFLGSCFLFCKHLTKLRFKEKKGYIHEKKDVRYLTKCMCWKRVALEWTFFFGKLAQPWSAQLSLNESCLFQAFQQCLNFVTFF